MEDIKNTPFNEEMSERVDRFLRKEMSDVESRAFAEEVKANPELREYYQRQFNLMRGIKIHEMRELMQTKEEKLATKKIAATVLNANFFARHRYDMTTVAVAAAMVLGVFVWDDNRTKSVGSDALAVVWKGSDPIDDCIEKGDYQKAIDLIDEEHGMTYELGDDPNAIAAYNQEMNNLKYRKALIYLKMGKKRAAKTILKELNDERSKEVLDKLLW